MPAGAVPGEPAPGGYVAEVMGVLGGEAVSVTEVGGMSGGSVHGMGLSVSEGRDGLVNGTRTPVARGQEFLLCRHGGMSYGEYSQGGCGKSNG